MSHPLLEAVQNATASTPPSLKSTARGYERLSERYRNEQETDEHLSADDVLAYCVARLPATLASVQLVFEDVQRVLPQFEPRSVMDLGAGPGTVGWAACTSFESVETVTFTERAKEMFSFGQKLARSSGLPALVSAEWLQHLDDTRDRTASLVCASYLLGELPKTSRDQMLTQWWASTKECLALIEPGTPAGAERLSAARATLTAAGAFVVAPCSTGSGCVSAGGWCHFAARVQRSAEHRLAKGATLGHEDEKYAYLIASRTPADTSPIVVRDPERRSGHVRMSMCGDDGLITSVVSKRDGDAYRWARGSRWGDRAPTPPSG